MGRKKLIERAGENVFILDGAMGTQLAARGLEAGKCNDYANIESPEMVFEIHRAYFEAGSDAVITNTFGSNRFSLARHGLAEKAEQTNTAAAKIARRAAGEQKYVLGDIGPCGDFLKPLGSLEPDELRDAFAEQAGGLLAGGVDGFIIETMTALDETILAIEAAKSVCELPIFSSMSFDSAGGNYRTMMGVSVENAVSKMAAAGADAVGFNCGKMSMDEYVILADKFISAVKKLDRQVLLLAEPNAGLPELIDGKTIYNLQPADFAEAIAKIYSSGINILGGCCGTAPQYIEAITNKLNR